jgi:DNA-binding IclR family transcriptional regulator
MAVLLRVVAGSEPNGVRTSDAAESACLPRPTVHRLLTAMSREGFVDRAATGLWRVGPELFLMGVGAAPRYDSRNLAQPILRRLAVATGESASFSIRRGDETVCLLHEEGTFPLRSHVLREGVRFPLGVASAGIAILAFMPAAESRRYLEHADLATTWGDQHSTLRVDQRLTRTRETGYSVNPGLIIPGRWGIAAAVFDNAENPLGAVSLTGVEARFAPDRRDSLGKQLLKAALDLSVQVQRSLIPERRGPLTNL